MTDKRIEEISRTLLSNKEETKKILQSNTSEAVAMLNKNGLIINEEELLEYGSILKPVLDQAVSISKGDELSEDDLENVSGGSITLALFVVAMSLALADYQLIKAFGWPR